jgi:hypothetical protein
MLDLFAHIAALEVLRVRLKREVLSGVVGPRVGDLSAPMSGALSVNVLGESRARCALEAFNRPISADLCRVNALAARLTLRTNTNSAKTCSFIAW